MNVRTTTLLFGLLLTTLWVFGLIVSQEKRASDQTALLPSLQKEDPKIEKVVIKQAGGKDQDAGSFEFVNVKDHWYYTQGDQRMRVEDFQINSIVDAVKRARADESADTSKDLSHYGLKSPQLTVTLQGKVKDEDKTWTMYVGKESPEQPTPLFYYVNSSEREEKAFATPRRPLEKLFIKDVNSLRSKRLFDFVEASVKQIAIEKGSKKLDIVRGEGNIWTATEPKGLGFLGFDSTAPEDKSPEDSLKKKKTEEPISGVKSLLANIVKVNVEDVKDFVPLGKPLSEYDLDPKAALMKIEVTTREEGKDPVKDTLYIGKKVPDRKETFYYARLASDAGDEGVFMLPAKTIDPIEQAVADPGKLRSLDVSVLDPKKLDYMNVRTGKDDYKFILLDPNKPWDMFVGKEKKKTNDSTVDKMAENLLGKKAIIEFLDFAEVDKDKKLTEWGLKEPQTEISVFVNAVEKSKKDEPKKDEAKKDDKDKKEDKDKMPDLKKDIKPELKLAFGRIEKDEVYVHRTLADGTQSYFKAKKEFLDSLVPPQGVELAYLDPSLPDLKFHNILSIKIDRKADKGTESVELERFAGADKDIWYLKDPMDPTGLKLAESRHMNEMRARLENLRVKKWVKRLDDKEDLDKYGLKNPSLTVTFRVEKNAEDLASMMAAFAMPLNSGPWSAISAALARHRSSAATETVVLQVGSEASEEKHPEKDKDKDKEKDKVKGKDRDKDKPGVYAKHSGSKLLFILPNDFVKFVKDTDLRDRGLAMHTQGRLLSSLIGAAAGNPVGVLMLASPYGTGQVQNLDPDKVKDIQLAVRSPYEFRSYHFERIGKDKDRVWTVKSGLQDSTLDPEKMNQFVKDLAKLRSDRIIAIVGGPRSEHKLGAKDFTIKLDMTLDDGKTVTLLVGATYQNQGYYANSSVWPETVFMLPESLIEPILQGAGHFAKERSGASQ